MVKFLNILKKIIGYCCIIIAPYIIFKMVDTAFDKVVHADEINKTNLFLQWFIILLAFVPCCIGLIIFGWYAITGVFQEENSQS